ncbi:MAG: FRG domain-containing protein [bacterium]|nr:FRG domain-containing protein [bacterium]
MFRHQGWVGAMAAPAQVTAAEYWQSYELDSPVSTIDEAIGLISQASAGTSGDWVWRGVQNAEWGLHSSLAREIKRATASWPDEAAVCDSEDALVRLAQEWSLHRHSSGPLSGLEVLAALQHTGSATRLIDVTNNALIALWFATEPAMEPGCDQCTNGCDCGEGTPEKDGRVFAIDSSQRRIEDHVQTWLNDPDLPWFTDPQTWRQDYFVWSPPPFEPRMAAQHGGFLLGPTPNGPNYSPEWYLAGQADQRFNVGQVKSVGSLPLRCHGDIGGQGRPTARPVRTFRVASASKLDLRRQLDELFDLSYRTLFPDLAGFARYRNR